MKNILILSLSALLILSSCNKSSEKPEENKKEEKVEEKTISQKELVINIQDAFFEDFSEESMKKLFCNFSCIFEKQKASCSQVSKTMLWRLELR